MQDLLALTQLRDVTYYRVAAERSGEVPSDTSEYAPPPTISVSERHGADAIEVRTELTWAVFGGQYTIDVAAQYGFDEPVEISAEVAAEFVQRVGVMTLFPYLRETIQALASKLRLTPPVLGLLHASRVSLITGRQTGEDAVLGRD